MSSKRRSGIGFLQALNSDKSYWVNYALTFDSASGHLVKGRANECGTGTDLVGNYYLLRLAEGDEIELLVWMVGAVMRSPAGIVAS